MRAHLKPALFAFLAGLTLGLVLTAAPLALRTVDASSSVSVDVNAAKTSDVDAAVAGTGGLRLVGFAARESAATAAAATFAIVNGATADGGTGVFPVELLPNESRSEWLGDDGIRATSGLSIDVTAGTVDVYLFYKD